MLEVNYLPSLEGSISSNINQGLFHEDLIEVYIRSSSQDSFKKRGYWVTFLDDLKNDSVAWRPALHENVLLMYGSNKNPILLIGSSQIEGNSLICVVHQFAWTHEFLLPWILVGFR